VAHAVQAQRLPEIGVLLGQFDALIGGRIQEPSHSPHRVDRKTARFRAGAGQIGLQHTIDEADGKQQVVIKIFDADPRRFRHRLFVPLGNRLQQPEIQAVIEPVHKPVERFDGIGDGDAFIRERLVVVVLAFIFVFVLKGILRPTRRLHVLAGRHILPGRRRLRVNGILAFPISHRP